MPSPRRTPTPAPPKPPEVMPTPPPVLRFDPTKVKPNTILTPELRTQVLQAVRQGVPVQRAINIIGISSATWTRWMSMAKDPPDIEFWRDFGEELEIARTQGMYTNLQRIDAASQEPAFWTASAWKLERTFPEHFAKTQTVSVNYTHLKEDEFRDAIAAEGFSGLLIGPEEEGVTTGSTEAGL